MLISQYGPGLCSGVAAGASCPSSVLEIPARICAGVLGVAPSKACAAVLCTAARCLLFILGIGSRVKLMPFVMFKFQRVFLKLRPHIENNQGVN